MEHMVLEAEVRQSLSKDSFTACGKKTRCRPWYTAGKRTNPWS